MVRGVIIIVTFGEVSFPFAKDTTCRPCWQEYTGAVPVALVGPVSREANCRPSQLRYSRDSFDRRGNPPPGTTEHQRPGSAKPFHAHQAARADSRHHTAL